MTQEDSDWLEKNRARLPTPYVGMSTDDIENYFQYFYNLKDRPSWEPYIPTPTEHNAYLKELRRRRLKYFQQFAKMQNDGRLTAYNKDLTEVSLRDVRYGELNASGIVTSKRDAITFISMLGLEVELKSGEQPEPLNVDVTVSAGNYVEGLWGRELKKELEQEQEAERQRKVERELQHEQEREAERQQKAERALQDEQEREAERQRKAERELKEEQEREAERQRKAERERKEKQERKAERKRRADRARQEEQENQQERQRRKDQALREEQERKEERDRLEEQERQKNQTSRFGGRRIFLTIPEKFELLKAYDTAGGGNAGIEAVKLLGYKRTDRRINQVIQEARALKASYKKNRSFSENVGKSPPTAMKSTADALIKRTKAD